MIDHPRPTPDHLPIHLLAIVGKIAIQAAYADFLIGEVFGGLTKADEEKRNAKIRGIDTWRKIKSIKEVQANDLVLLELLTKAESLFQDRNVVIHGIITYVDEEFSIPEYTMFRGKNSGKRISFSEQTLIPILSELDDLCRHLLKICLDNEYVKHVPLQHRNT